MNDDASLSAALERLRTGQLHSFREPLDPAIPRRTAGCYTIWDDSGRFIYAGMAGGGMLTQEAIRAVQENSVVKVGGLRDRLDAHRSGRRSGDQFCVYVFDRLVLPSLSPEQIGQAANGFRRLDEDVKAFVHEHLSYRWASVPDGQAAYALERVLLTAGLGGLLPLLNAGRVG